ncbi:unnamed protein product [Ambrosiozyma monospora]|uniref:Unnamed protein product n=1 Tax=Ambrosiozyma monospora TaxID=43982 RepID=A0ACB5TXG9_AMBMO|nr:unnamed protein product [Ambrosiozyma monospora]
MERDSQLMKNPDANLNCCLHETVAKLKLEPEKLDDTLENNTSSELLKNGELPNNSMNDNPLFSTEKLDNKPKIMSNLSSSPINVLEITRSLPLEIQCLVLKHSILEYMKSLDSYLTPDKDIVKFIGYNSILDDIMVLVLQELGFLATVFTHDDFNDIAEFK